MNIDVTGREHQRVLTGGRRSEAGDLMRKYRCASMQWTALNVPLRNFYEVRCFRKYNKDSEQEMACQK